MKSAGPSDKGFALVFVLVGLALLSLVGALMMIDTRWGAAVSRRELESVRLDAIADAAVNRAVLGLIDQRRDHRWRVDGVERHETIDGVAVTIVIQDQYGLYDLNRIGRPVLVELLKEAGAASDDIDRLADCILDWREAGPGKRLNGAGDQDYAAAGLRWRPRHAPFAALDELRLVLGMTQAVYDGLVPALTIQSQAASIDPATAPLQVLMTLPGIDRETARQRIEQRTSGNGPAAASGPVSGGIIDPAIPLAGWAFDIRVSLPAASNRVWRQDTMVRLTGAPDRPYWVLDRAAP